MRVQEHIYQGFFGLKKKEDVAKYYNDRLKNLKGIDSDIDRIIQAFEIVLENHKKKLDTYVEFVKDSSNHNLKKLKQEIQRLEGMFDQDEVENDTEKRFTLKVIDKIKDLIKTEESSDLKSIQNETLRDLSDLSKLLDSMGPVWQAQLDFIKKNDDEIIHDNQSTKLLSAILHEESQILKMEEDLLRRIDNKTGNVIRKTELRVSDMEKTKDMNLEYRDIRFVR